MTQDIFLKYAKVLFDLAHYKNEVDKTLKEYQEWLEAIEKPENRFFFDMPTKLQLQVIEETSSLSSLTASFLKQVIQAHLTLFLSEIYRYFVRLVEENKGKIILEITFAKEETEEYKKQLQEILSFYFQKTVFFEEKIDPNLIGGFVFYYQGKEYNFSIAGLLQKMSIGE